MSVCPPACLLLEAAFPNLGMDVLTREGSMLTVGQLAVIRTSELTLPPCIISGPTNPQWKSKAGTQEMGVE